MPITPPVGVVIINHNNSAFVERAIASVQRQTMRDLRVVVVDDASTDGSEAVIRRSLADLDDPRFTFVGLETNIGQTAALTRGLAFLDTPFVAVLDSDDVWYETFVARHLECQLNSDFPVALTYSDSHLIDGDDRLLAGTAWWFDSSEPGHWAGRDIGANLRPVFDPATGTLNWPARPRVTLHPQWSMDGATNTMSGMMFRRAFIDLVLVPPSEHLRLYADYYLSTFACLLTGAIAIHQPLYAYRMHGANKHSNATVLGGTYNSSTREWGPIRDYVLLIVQEVLTREAPAIRAAFGVQRHAEAEALLAGAIDKAAGRRRRGPRPSPWLGELAAGLIGMGLARLGLRGRS